MVSCGKKDRLGLRFGVLPKVPSVIFPMVPLVANSTIDITIGSIGRTLNDIGIPLVPLVPLVVS